MNQDEALNLSRLLSDGETAELRAAEEHLAAKCRHEQMSRTAVLMNWGDPREWKPAAGAQAAQRTPNLSGCEVMVDGEGVSLESNKPFGFTCCDCGLTHRCVIVSEDGKPVGFAIERDQKATEEIRASTPEPLKLWLWKNFVDGRPEYWAFDNPYPCMPGGGDPLTLGEPCGYALVKESSNGRPDVPEEKVLAAINRASGLRVVGHACKLDGSICESRPDRCSDCPAAGGKP